MEIRLVEVSLIEIVDKFGGDKVRGVQFGRSNGEDGGIEARRR